MKSHQREPDKISSALKHVSADEEECLSGASFQGQVVFLPVWRQHEQTNMGNPGISGACHDALSARLRRHRELRFDF